MDTSRLRLFSARTACQFSIAVASLCLLITNTNAQLLEEIVVTAQKRAENIQDVPIAISALDSGILERSSIENVNDLTFHVPNLQFGNFSSTATAALRGIGTTNTTAGGDPGVALHIDGVYLGRPVATIFSAFDLERMEVLRGPQGTLYGRNTTGGSINYISKKPTDEFEGQVDISYGEFDHVMTRGTVNVPINDTLAARFNVVWSDSDGFQENLLGGTESGDNDFVNFRGSLRADISEDAELIISVNRSDVGGVGSTSQTRLPNPADNTQDFGPPIAGFRNFSGVPDQNLQTILSDEFVNGTFRPQLVPLLTANGINTVADVEAFLAARGQIQPGPGGIGLFVPTPGGAVIPAPWFVDDVDFSQASPNNTGANTVRKNIAEDNDQEFTSVSGTFTWDLDWAEFKSITAYAESSFSSLSDLDATDADLMSILLTEEQDQFTQEVQLASTGEGPWTWLVGAYFYTEEGTRISRIFNPDFDTFGDLLGLPEGFNVGGTAETDSYALFTQISYDITETIKLTGGFRFSWDEKNAVINLTSPFPSFELATLVRDAQVGDSWSEPTYKFVADWQATDDVLLYASFSRGYKSGGVNLNGAPATAVYDPEFVDVWEIGAKATINDRFQINLAAFTNDYTDIQVQSFGATGASIINAAAATINGLETEGIFAITDNTEVNFAFSWLDATFDDFPFTPPALPTFPFLANIAAGNPPGSPGFDIRGPSNPLAPLGPPPTNFAGNKLARAPEFSYSIGAQHIFNLGSDMGTITLRADFYWQDEQWFDFDNGIGSNGIDALGDSYHNLDLKGRWDSADESYFVEVFGANVTDEDQIRDILISIPFLGLGVDLTTYNAPATWGARVGYRF